MYKINDMLEERDTSDYLKGFDAGDYNYYNDIGYPVDDIDQEAYALLKEESEVI